MITSNRFSIPVTTLPHVRHLLSSVLAQRSSGKLWCHPGQKVFFSYGSACGISEAIKALLKFRGKAQGVIFLPDYFCNQALMPLRLQPVQLAFYPVTENLNPDWSLMGNLITQYGSPDVFILVHYFGFPGEITRATQFCQQVGAELLEDGAHVLMPFGEVGKNSWVTVFSPYKLLPIPKIGIVVTSEKNEIYKEKYWGGGKFDIDVCKWIGKRSLQSFLTYCKISWRNGKVAQFELDIETEFNENLTISTFPLQLLKILESKLSGYKIIRREYYKIIEEQILLIKNDVANPVFLSLPDDVCPYLFPMRMHSSIIENVYYSLNRMGIPAQTWPDLPPEIKENPYNKIAKKLRGSILTIPIHQSLTKNHIEYIAHNLHDVILEALRNK